MASSSTIKLNLAKGKKFLVSGATRGIGKALVAELHEQGAIVYAMGRDPAALLALTEEFSGVKTLCFDLSDWNATRKALEDVEAVDCLVNVAGVSGFCPFWEIEPEQLDLMYNINIRAVINLSQIVAKKMIEKGNGGSIINITSLATKRNIPPLLGHNVMKAGVEMLTKGMALELAKHKITVNSVAPGILESEMDLINGPYPDDMKKRVMDLIEEVKAKTPTGVVLIPTMEIINTIIFLGCNVATQLTGESIFLDGGFNVDY